MRAFLFVNRKRRLRIIAYDLNEAIEILAKLVSDIDGWVVASD